MMNVEPRNEQLMLRQFWKKHPTYNLNALMRKRYEEAKAFNEWLQNRQLKQQGEEYLDAMGRMAEAVNRRVPFPATLGWGRTRSSPQGEPTACGERRAPSRRVAFATTLVNKTWKSNER